MPNGEDVVLVRLVAAVDGFRVRYGRWPTRVRVFPGVPAALQEILTPEAYERLCSLLTLIPDENGASIAEDETGNQYHYGREGFPSTRPTPDATEWLAPELRGDA